MQIAIVLALLILAVVLFALEKLSVDIITIILLVALVITGILTPAEAFAGFSEEIIIILCSIFVLSGSMRQNGVMDWTGQRLYVLARGSANRLLLAVMALVSAISSFMNNTTATAIFIPPVIGVARQSGISPSKLLMPLAFASILGGTCTLIGTSTNVAVSGYIARSGMEPLSLFEITPIGIVLVAVGIAYMMSVGKRLLPDHKDVSLTEDYAIREYLSEIVVLPDSDLVGQRVFESDLSRTEFRILEVIRKDRKFLPDERTTMEPNDILLVEGKVEQLLAVKEKAGIEIRADARLGDRDLQTEDIKIAEALIPPQSELIGKTLKEVDFRTRYLNTALAIYRHGHSVRDKVGRIPLRMGDLLLIQGSADRMEALKRHPDLWILETQRPLLHRRSKGLYTVLFFAAAILAGALGWLPLSIAFLAAAALTVLFRCISVTDVYELIDWRMIILIGGMTAFGTAMEKTGTAAFLAGLIVGLLEPWGPMMILGGFFLVTIILTQPMSNAAAALVVLPVAIATAQGLGVNERTFAIGIMLAASVSFITPFEPSCLLVYGPGKYRFTDFVKCGLLLTMILMIVALLLVPLFWPLRSASVAIG